MFFISIISKYFARDIGARLTLPWANDPTTKTMGRSSGMSVFISAVTGALKDVFILVQPVGRWSVMGFLITYIWGDRQSPGQSQYWIPIMTEKTPAMK